MSKPILLLLALVSIITISFNSALAQCRKDPRQVQSKDESGREVVLKFSSYVCGLRGNGRESTVGVEFYRLGNPVASVFAFGNDSNLLRIFGPYEIQNNEIFSQFKRLVSQFSDRPEDNNTDHTHLHSSVYLNDHYEYNDYVYFDFKKANVTGIVDYLVGSDPDTEGDTVYPAIDDVHQLDQRILPHNMSVFYVKSDNDAKDVQAVFWRYGTLQDVIKYPANVTAWNLAARANEGLDPSLFVPDEKFPWKERYHKFLGLLLTLTRGQELPEGYLILSGKFTKERCTQPSWEFHMDSPEISLETMLIRNDSNRTFRLDALVGDQFGEARLRKAETPLPRSTLGASPIRVGSVIPPGHSLLVPTRILLKSRYFPPTEDAAIKGAEVYRRLISRGISARPDVYGRPVAPDFAFGPQLNISGITVDGYKISLSSNSTNLMDVSFAWGRGSCPYLASWDERRMRWLQYGKVLHPAEGQGHESVQSIVLPGFISRFRLEEREPEVTTLDRTELFLTLRDGSQVTAQPINTDWRSMFPSHLFWNETQEFAFALPRGVSPDDVTQSRLVLTGYYQRYSSLPNFSRGDGAAYLRAALPSEPKPSH
jgi:hypothetical protein